MPNAAETVARPTIRVTFSQLDEKRAEVSVAGQLDSAALPEAWAATVDPLNANTASELVIDVSKLDYLDGAGLGLFAELRRIAAVRQGSVKLVGVKQDQQRFIEMSTLADPTAAQLKPRSRRNVITQFGKSVWDVVLDLHELVSFIGEVTFALLWAVRHPFKIRMRETLRIAEKAGANALPVVCLLGLLIGVILAFQTASPLARFGAQPLIPTIVAIAVVREMGPLITAVILSGRSGSAFAAEIGTMQVTEELAALKTLGLEPVRFLVIPRVLAALLVTPLLTVFNILMSIFGAYLIMASLGYSLAFFVDQVTGVIKLSDFVGGVAKSFVFALIVAGIGCLRGIQTRSGPGAVGDSTTRAVVAGIVLTIIADAVIGIVYYYMGI